MGFYWPFSKVERLDSETSSRSCLPKRGQTASGIVGGMGGGVKSRSETVPVQTQQQHRHDKSQTRGACGPEPRSNAFCIARSPLPWWTRGHSRPRSCSHDQPYTLPMHVRTPLLRAIVLGCITTIAVSCAFALGLKMSSTTTRFAHAGLAADGTFLGLTRSDSTGFAAIAAAASDSIVRTDARNTLELPALVPSHADHELLDWARHSPAPSLPTTFARCIILTGWPMRAMWSSYDQQPPRPGTGGPNVVSPSIPVPGRLTTNNTRWFKSRNGLVVRAAPQSWTDGHPFSPRDLVLPTRIVWLGFVVDVVFWTGLWMVPLFVVGAWRRSRRQRLGRCADCGYNRTGLSTDAPCPECGTTIRSSGQSSGRPPAAS